MITEQQAISGSPAAIEFWFEFGSTYSYLSLRLRSQTELAKTKGIFGAPTFFVGEEMFWGNDRLDDALAYCQASIDHSVG